MAIWTRANRIRGDTLAGKTTRPHGHQPIAFNVNKEHVVLFTLVYTHVDIVYTHMDTDQSGLSSS
jgi:hypothetical protein